MKVFIVRHAQAQTGKDDDAARSLTENGQQTAQQLAIWLATHLNQSVKIVASPYLRAMQTAQIIAAKLNCEVQQNALFTPTIDAEQALAQLSEYQQDVLLVSHQPLVGRLASLLVAGDEQDQPWQTAECRILEGDCAYSGCMQVKTLWYPA